MIDVILKRFEAPDEVRQMVQGRFEIVPESHDSWVIGDEPYVSLHFLGAEHYAR